VARSWDLLFKVKKRKSLLTEEITLEECSFEGQSKVIQIKAS